MATTTTRKDEKIQVYSQVKKTVEGTTKEQKHRLFIYPQDVYKSGGLWAHAVQLLNSQAVNNGLEVEQKNVKFTINRNTNLDNTQKVIYRGEVYDIKTIDDFDFRSREMSFTAVLSVDKTKYAEDLFNETDKV